jgi:hypothetical protein
MASTQSQPHRDFTIYGPEEGEEVALLQQLQTLWDYCQLQVKMAEERINIITRAMDTADKQEREATTPEAQQRFRLSISMAWAEREATLLQERIFKDAAAYYQDLIAKEEAQQQEEAQQSSSG